MSETERIKITLEVIDEEITVAREAGDDKLLEMLTSVREYLADVRIG